VIRIWQRHGMQFRYGETHGRWRHLKAVEFATLEWVDWFNHRRLLEPIGYVPPAEYEARYYEQAPAA
jgi:transposase InsO family protein